MFQKLKDKLAEEVKQSSLKFPVSVQQITQAVSSSSSPGKLVNTEPSGAKESNDLNETSLDNVSLNSEYDSSFTTIDLRSPIPNRNRRSSSSSDLFPIYEFLPNRLNLQSDLESTSEFDDGSSIHQFTNVSKEFLYEKYKSMLQKYHKYRGRFADMRKYCLELEREHDKMKNILSETQDKAIRRTKELKEQCTLEQTAKAHLEDVLRNELEERDLIISTLNTKIQLLKCGKDNSLIDEQHQVVVDVSKNQVVSNSFQEIELLKDKIKNFELLLSKAKEAITTKNAQIKTLESRIESGKNELKVSNEHITQLQNKIDLMKHKEEEALLSLAENKMVVHKELEAKEKHIKILEDKISQYESEIKKSKTRREQMDINSNSESINCSEEIRAKDDEIKSLKNELLQLKRLRNNFSNMTEESLVELNHSYSKSTLDFEETKTELAEVKEYKRKIEEQKLMLLEKQKELDLLSSTKDIEIVQLLQVKAHQDNEISSLKAEISKMKDEVSDHSKIYQEVGVLSVSLQETRDALSDKDKQLKSHVEMINKLQSELLVVNNKLTDSVKYQKMYEETVTSSKADKIIAEEMMKNVKKELNVNQIELKNAIDKIEKYESELKNNDEIIREKCHLEKQLLDCKNDLERVIMSLEQAKETEHEIQVQTANYLEEINELKSKEDGYLKEIRKLKDDLSSMQKLKDEVKQLKYNLEENQQQSKKLIVENELIKNENYSFKEKIEDLKNCMNDLEQSLLAKKKLLVEHDSFANRQTTAELIENLNKSVTENAELKLENEKIIKSNEEISEKIGKLFAEKKSLNEEVDSLKQNKSITASRIEKLKTLCELNEYFSDEQDILIAVFEKISRYINENILIQKDNENFKSEIEVLENFRKENKMLVLEKESLENRFFEENSKFNKLSLQYTQIQQDLESANRLQEKTEKKVCNLESKLALFAESSINNKEKMQEENEVEEETIASEGPTNKLTGIMMEGLSKSSVSDLETVIKNVSPLSASYRDIILHIHSHLIDLKLKNKNVKNDLSYLRKCLIDPSNESEISFQQLMKIINNFGEESETMRYQLLLLKKEKEELLVKIRNLEKEIIDIKKQSEESLYQREIFFKEKYSQEMTEIVSGYEIRLAEKDNEYEALQNKINLRTDRENSAAYLETKEVIQNLQEELTARQDSYAELLIKHKNKVEEFDKKILDLKEQYAKELRENDKKWRSCLDKKIEGVEEKYKDEINELTKEWAIDRKFSSSPAKINTKDSKEFLEDSAKQYEDSEALKKQVQILTNELNNCKRSHWREIDLNLMNVSYDNAQHSNITLEDCTEMEYLRNILFKYMMGHQPMVLAKVLAAVVKFDNNQTEQVLLREEQKQSLIGHLGLT